MKGMKGYEGFPESSRKTLKNTLLYFFTFFLSVASFEPPPTLHPIILI